MTSDSQLRAFGSRLQRCDRQVFGSVGISLIEDPITGRLVRIIPNRRGRHNEGKNQTTFLNTERDLCYFCTLSVPSLLLWVDRFGEIVVLDEEASFEAADAFLHGKPYEIQTFYGLVKKLAHSNKIPDPDWLATTFPNLTPALEGAETGPPCLVTSLNPKYHDTEFHDLPRAAVKAIIQSWAFVERWALSQGKTAVPFINGGRRPESGQSVACCHAQIYLFDYVPALFKQIERRREAAGGECPICTVIVQKYLKDLAIYETATLAVLAHPAPKRSWSLLIVPKKHVAYLHEVNADEFADVLQRSVGAYKKLNGIEPAHNIVVRCGDAVGHLHAELVPKTETCTPAGLEEATDETTIDVAPTFVVEQMKPLMAGGQNNA